MRHAVTVAVLLVAVAVGACAAPGPTPTPEGFRLEPVRPARADQLARARDQLQGRLSFIGVDARVTVAGKGLFVEMPLNEATPRFVERLTSRGEVWIVPVPPGADIPIAGQPLDLRPLIRNDGFADARAGESDGRPTLQLALHPEAAAILGVHTSAHVGEAIAIVVDGIVVSAPRIQEPILEGQMLLDMAGDREDPSWIVGLLRYGVVEIELIGGPY